MSRAGRTWLAVLGLSLALPFAGLHAKETQSPSKRWVLATREGVRVAQYADIPRERRTGYTWYGNWPQNFLDRDYPKWQKRVAADAKS